MYVSIPRIFNTLIPFIFSRDKFGRYHDFWLEFGPAVPDFDEIWATIIIFSLSLMVGVSINGTKLGFFINVYANQPIS